MNLIYVSTYILPGGGYTDIQIHTLQTQVTSRDQMVMSSLVATCLVLQIHIKNCNTYTVYWILRKYLTLCFAQLMH